MLKNLNHYEGRTKNKTPAPHDKKIKLSNIKFDEEKLRNLLTPQREPKIRCYYEVYSDDGVETGNELSENNSESNDEEIVRKTKTTQTRKRTVVKTNIKPAAKKKKKKKQQNQIIDYINS